MARLGRAQPVPVIVRTTPRVKQSWTAALAGTVAPAGALVKRAGKKVAGSLTPPGVLTTHRLKLLAFAGSVTPTGRLVKRAAKKLAGVLTPAATLGRMVGKRPAGALVPAAAVGRVAQKKLSGVLVPVGNLARGFFLRFSGSVTPAGDERHSVTVAPYNFGAFVDDRRKPRPEWDPSGVHPKMARD